MAFLPRSNSVVDALMTPDQVARKRQQAEFFAAQAAGFNAPPADNWLGAIVQGLRGFEAGRLGKKAENAEAAGLASADDAIRGNPIIASLLGGDQAGMAQPSPVASALAATPQADVPSAFSGSAGAFPASLIETESGGNWNALNNEQGAGGRGHGGRLQFGHARLADAARAGVIQPMTPQEFAQQPPQVQQAVENWHFSDIDQQAANMGLNQFIGQTVGGVPVTQDAIRGMAHLGGIGGAAKFLQSGGQHNPADSFGTSLRDYGIRHSGSGGVPAPMSGVGGASAPQAPNNVVAALAQAQSNPWVQQKYGGVIEALMGQQMTRDNAAYQQQLRQSDPMYQLQLEQAQMQNEALRNPVQDPWSGVQEINGQLVRMGQGGPEVIGDYRTQEPQYQTITGQQAAEMGLDPNAAYNVGPDGKISQIGGSGVTVNNNMGEDKFGEAFAKGDAATIETVSNAGMQAQRNIGRIDRLESLLAQGPTGMAAGVKSALGEYGIQSDGLDTLQAAQALINSMVPEQRQPGSGPMSDADLALFKQSLPRLINNPDGNAMITHTLRGIAQYDAEGAQITQRLRAGEIDRATAFQMLQERPNPLAGFGEGAARFAEPEAAQGLSGAGWQDVNGVRIRRKGE